MNAAETTRLTAVAFIAYFVMSGMLAPIGILSGPMAELFNLPVTTITARFSSLTLGLLAGSVAALFVFRLFTPKLAVMVSMGSIALCLLALNLVGSGPLAWVMIAGVGVGCGIGLACGALIIARRFEDRLRAAMLVLTDSCFSIAGVICSTLAVWFVAAELAWYSTYQVLAALCLVGVVLAGVSRFGFVTPALEQSVDVQSLTVSQWPLPVWLVLLALSCYTLGTNCFLLWLPNYGQQSLGLSLQVSGGLVGQYWLGMFIGQLLVAGTVAWLGVLHWVRLAAVGTVLGSLPLWLLTDGATLSIAALCWGIANFGLLKMGIAFATSQVRIPPGEMVAALMLAGTFGTSISAWVTSNIVAASSSYFVLQVGTGCLFVMAMAIIGASLLNQAESSRQSSVG